MQHIIQTTAGEIQDVLKRRGLQACDPITVTITVDPRIDLLQKARTESRAIVIESGLTDDDIDRLIKECRQEVAFENP